MLTGHSSPGPRGLSALRRFARRPQRIERCEFCSAPLGLRHDHLVEPAKRALLCVCYPCSVLFLSDGGTRYRRVPREARCLPDFELTDGQWESLGIPIGIVFFLHSSPVNRVTAVYPSPGGPLESQLALDSWSEIASANPVLERMRPDVEALLVNRIGEAREHYIAPIDECYRLTGLIRRHWRGLQGDRKSVV